MNDVGIGDGRNFQKVGQRNMVLSDKVGGQAVKFRDRAEKILQRLEDFPEPGRIIPEFPELPYQEVIISPYRFFYKIKAGIVWIIAVWQRAQIQKEPKD